MGSEGSASWRNARLTRGHQGCPQHPTPAGLEDRCRRKCQGQRAEVTTLLREPAVRVRRQLQCQDHKHVAAELAARSSERRAAFLFIMRTWALLSILGLLRRQSRKQES